MPNQERGFAHLLLIIALFGLISVLAVSFLNVRTPNYGSIANPLPPLKPVSASDHELEKTYVNSQFGLSFSYSSENYSAKEDTEEAYFQRANGDARKNFTYYVNYQPGEFLGAVNLVSQSGGQFDDAPFLVWIFKNPDNLDGAGWFKKYWYYPFNWGQFESSQKVKLAPVNTATIGGQTASFGEIDYQAGDPKYYYVSNGGKMYLIRVLNNDKTIDSLKFQ